MRNVTLYENVSLRPLITVPWNTAELKIDEPASALQDLGGFLASLPKLEKLVLFTRDLSKTDCTESLDFLRSAKHLTWLSLGSMDRLRDCDALAECKKLEFLCLDRRSTFDFEVLPSAASLRRLSVEMPKKAALSQIARSVQITQLELRGGFNLPSLEPLARLKSLEKLRLWSGRLNSSHGLAAFEKLESLDLGYSGLRDTTELGNGKRIRQLELIGNKRISGLEFLRDGGLTTLGLYEVPKLESIKPVLRLSNLREFKSSGAIMDGDITPLTQIPTLEKASLHRMYGPTLRAIKVDCSCVFQAGRERFKLTKSGPVILETAADAKKSLLDKLARGTEDSRSSA